MKKLTQLFLMLSAALMATTVSANNQLINDMHQDCSIVPYSSPRISIGDVNGDGIVDISDVTRLIDFLLGDYSNQFYFDNADTDLNSSVTISDVTHLIDYLLVGCWPWEAFQPVTEDFTVNGVTFKMVPVEGGTFTMGALTEQDTINHEPTYWSSSAPHPVTLTGYKIGLTEVTQELWYAVMGTRPSYNLNTGDMPVESVSWGQCQEFIGKLNEMTGHHFRMPTEAEWEYAARGGNLSQGYRFSGSNDIDEVAWYCRNVMAHYSAEYFSGTTKPVATKMPNELGLHDMSGNVSEWCLDYASTWSSEAQTDPTGPTSGSNRVYRGGNYMCDTAECNVAKTLCDISGYGYTMIGLRLALDEDDSPKFRLSESVVSIMAGESATADILNGNGIYTIEGQGDNATCTISGNRLTVTGTQEGVTSIHITDASTGATAVLPVVVKPKPTEEYTVNGVTFTMVRVEGGTFMLNDIHEAGYHLRFFPWEANVPYLTGVNNFCLGKTEVTQELWQAVMGNNPSYFKGDPNRPVEQVSWDDCQKFITKLNELTDEQFRLPSETEWEFASRGGVYSKAYTYSGSNDINNVAWHWNNIPSQNDTFAGYGTQPVATLAPNELGLYDMSGNVWEWCLDSTDGSDYYSVLNDGGPYKIRRGGCWSSEDSNCTVLTRSYSSPEESYNRLGFRLAIYRGYNPY